MGLRDDVEGYWNNFVPTYDACIPFLVTVAPSIADILTSHTSETEQDKVHMQPRVWNSYPVGLSFHRFQSLGLSSPSHTKNVEKSLHAASMQ